LKTLYFTRKPGEKALGWDDIVRMQSMRDPQLLLCGHIGDLSVLKKVDKSLCPICRDHFDLTKLERIIPRITKLTKKNGKWLAEIVDHNRQPLDSKTLYHVECGEFYNFNTLVNKYHITTSSINQHTKAELHGKSCFACYNHFQPGKIRICFPESAKLDDQQQFDTLSTVHLYSLVNSSEHKQ